MIGCLSFCLTALATGIVQIPVILCTGMAFFVMVAGATLGADITNAIALVMQQGMTGAGLALTNLCGGA
jgi:hypothetical protein